MKKMIPLLLVLLVLLAGCGCEHIWKPATCDTAKACELCGETDGAPLGHVWQAATCDKAKTCEVCSKTEGEALGHDWQDATCETPKTCNRCKVTEGAALGHIWLEATTEAPKTCETCNATSGEAIKTDPRFTTSACKDFFGTWKGEGQADLAPQLGMEVDIPLTVTAYYTYTFNNDGTATMHVSYEEESFLSAMRYVTIEMLYEAAAQQGLSRAEIDAQFQAEYGMDVATYVDAELAKINVEDYAMDLAIVYYVADDQLFMAVDWASMAGGNSFTMDGNQITLENESLKIILNKQD